MTDYNNVYETRVGFKGVSKKEKIVNDGIRNFERYLFTAATVETILIDATYDLDVSIQTSSYNELGDRYEKIILAPLNSSLNTGSIFGWKNQIWLVIKDETPSIPTHFKGIVRRCNHVLKWQRQSENLLVPAHIFSSAIRSAGLVESSGAGIISEDPGLGVMAFVPLTEESSLIKRDSRFLIQDKAWRVISIDDVSVPKLRIMRLSEDILDMSKDDLNTGVADVIEVIETGGEWTDPSTGYIYTIEGPEFLYWGQTAEYDLKENGSFRMFGSFSFSGDIITEVVFETSNKGYTNLFIFEAINPATISISLNNEKQIGCFKIIFNFGVSLSLEKTISILSYWGQKEVRV